MVAVAASSVYHHVVAPVGKVVIDTGGELVRGVAKGMADRYVGLPMDKAAKVDQAQKMLAYLKSQLPADKADQAFKVLAEKGIFHQPRYAAVIVVPLAIIAIEELALLGVSATVLYHAWSIGGIPLTDRVRRYFDGAGVDTSEDTFERRRNEGDRSQSAAVPRAGTQTSAAGGNPDPDDKCQKKVPKSGGGKEKADDVPSRFRGERPYIWESGADFAKRLLDAECGVGNYKTGTGSDFARLQKWGNRGFELPKCSKKSKK